MNVIFEVLLLLLKVFYYYLEALFRLFVSPKAKSVRGKVVLVTGGGRGIGRCVALELAKLGAHVAVLDIDQTTCVETAALIRDSGGTARSYQCDVTKVKEVKAAVAKVTEDLGDVSILVNNAGVLSCKSILDLSEAEIRRTIEVNTLAQFWTVKEVLPSMIARKDGHIAVICSMSAKSSAQLLTDYCTSKWGTNGFCEALLDDLRYMKVTGVQLTTVYPMFVNTQLVTSFAHRAEPRSRFDEILTPEEVALATVQGIVCNRRYVYIPALMISSNLLGMLPHKLDLAVKDFIGAGFYHKG